MEISKKYLLLASREKVMVSLAGYSFPVKTCMNLSSRICHSEIEAFLVLVNCIAVFCDRADKGAIHIIKTSRLLFMDADKIQR
jgi:hypothetical protein